MWITMRLHVSVMFDIANTAFLLCTAKVYDCIDSNSIHLVTTMIPEK